MNKSLWFSNIGNQMVDEVNRDLDKAWATSFCQSDNPYKLPKYENAARCAELKPEHPSINNWSQDQFGLTYAELKILLN